MQKKICSILFVLIFIFSGYAEDIIWTEDTTVSLPDSIKLYKGTRTSPKLQAFYLDVNLKNAEIAVRPYFGVQTATLPVFTSAAGAYVAINAGFFGGSTSYSTIISPGELKAANVQSLARNNLTFPVIRSMFSIDTDGTMAVDWMYHFDNTLEGVYSFSQPLSYINNDPVPKSTPKKEDGTPLTDLLVAVGGAPVLIKNGVINITYDEEIMWGSGVGLDNRDPRTAVGYTLDNHVILFVADGRQTISEGVSLPELAQILSDLGCNEAINLDGGGSTQMALPGQYINSPSEQRPVPTIFAVVHKDSLGVPDEPQIEKIIDSGDSECELIGPGWFPTANSGFWGETPSMLHSKGDGSSYAQYQVNVAADAIYDVYAWWVASTNRCTDTPFIIHHKHGIDTVYKDQATNGSSWVPIGTYTFRGDSSEKIIVSDKATNGTYVVVDAIRLVTYDTTVTALTNSEVRHVPENFVLHQNYPNPFNPVTTIQYQLAKPGHVDISIYNLLGEKMTTLVNTIQAEGYYSTEWHADGFGSGVYFYRMLTADGQMQTRKLILLK